MPAPRTLLRPVAFLGARHAARQRRAFLRAHRRTRRVQDRLLRRLIAAAADSDFGRDHDFRRIRSYADFAAAVPVRDHEQLRPYLRRVFDGDVRALFDRRERVLMFSMTSGTTGRPKTIPVTRRFLAAIRRGWNIFGYSALRDHRAAWLRPILQVSSSMHERRSGSGAPCGAISGLLAATQKRIVRRMYAVPPQVAEVHDPSAKYYTILRCAAERDVALITTANPSSTIRLMETGREHVDRLLGDLAEGTLRPPGELPAAVASALRFGPNRPLARRLEQAVRRDGALYPRHLWRVALLCNWTGGTVGLYRPVLRELFGPVPVRDIGLLASEGRFSIPLADETPAGVAEITANVLEFIPADQRGSARPDVLRADEVEVGREYFLVVTNWAGLWRYDIDDRVRVTARLGRSPVFEFLSRGSHTASITGEKLTEHQVIAAMRGACGEVSAAVCRFVVQGRFSRPPYYELRLEGAPAARGAALAEAFDRHLKRLNVEYRAKRDSGRLAAVRPAPLPPGALAAGEEASLRARGGRAEQYKHQYLRTDVLPEAPPPPGDGREP
jgi:hypothetical protein